jgi:dedicator of cytokinesis protein 3
MPVQPIREANPSPTPSWPRSPPTASGFVPQPQNLGGPLLANGATTGEVKIIQPISLRQGRGARLSFLGGRKKDQKEGIPPVPQINGNSHAQEDESAGMSRSHGLGGDALNRRSFFRTTYSASENAVVRPPGHTNGHTEMSPATVGRSSRVDQSMDWVTDSGLPRDSSDATALEKEKSFPDHGSSGASGMLHMGGVKKRLSILRLGKKNSKGSGVMGSVDEE